MKFAICNETYQNWSWMDTCQHVAQSGYSGIEIAPFTLAADVRDISESIKREIVTIAADAGLEIIGLHWLLVTPKGPSMTTSDLEVRRNTSEYLVHLTQLCKDLGGKTLVLGSPAQRKIEPEVTRDETEDRFIHTLMPSLRLASDIGLIICIEPLPAPEANFILTLQEAVSIAKKCDIDSAKTIFDVKSACSEGTDLTTLIRDYCPWIRHVHANDSNRRGPGFGDVDFVPIMATLQETKYEGYVSVEVFDYSPDPETIATESIKYLRKCLT